MISSLVGIIVAFIAAMAVHGIGGRVKQLYLSMLNMVSNFAGISLAFSFIILLGNTGILTAFGSRYGITMLANFPLYSIKGLLAVYIYFQIPLAVMLTVPVFDTIKEEWKHAVSLLGGGAFSFWKSVGLPVILPGLMGTFSVLFANAVSAYATAYALLANNVSILPIRISEQFVGDIVQRPEFGSALAVVLILLMVLAILIECDSRNYSSYQHSDIVRRCARSPFKPNFYADIGILYCDFALYLSGNPKQPVCNTSSETDRSVGIAGSREIICPF